mgnify:CR=1 FL=1
MWRCWRFGWNSQNIEKKGEKTVRKLIGNQVLIDGASQRHLLGQATSLKASLSARARADHRGEVRAPKPSPLSVTPCSKPRRAARGNERGSEIRPPGGAGDGSIAVSQMR